MTLVRDTSLALRFWSHSPRMQAAVPVSLQIVSPLVALFDLCWILMIGLACGLAYDAFAHGGAGQIDKHLGTSMAVAMLYSAFAHAAGLYTAPNLLRIKWQVARALAIWVAVFVFLASLAFVLKIGALFSRGEMLLFLASGFATTTLVRVMVARCCAAVILSRILAPNQVVIVGIASEFAGNDDLSALDDYGYCVAKYFALPVDDEGETDERLLRERCREAVRYVRDREIDEVILALPWSRVDLVALLENELRVLPVPVKLLPDAKTSFLLRHPLLGFGPTSAVELQRAPLTVAERFAKRVMDQVMAAFGLFLLAPFLLIISVAVRLESVGSPLFFQTRIGFNGRPFKIYKFRTMITRDDGPVVVQATRNDRRVTQLGALLRKLSIDELPQLLNVLRGDMSLVGPRPHAVTHDNEYDRLIATYAMRQKMKPGITGWAQVNGLRGETAELWMMKQRVEKDIWYIESWSLWLDIRILFMTVFKVIKSDNAY